MRDYILEIRHILGENDQMYGNMHRPLSGTIPYQKIVSGEANVFYIALSFFSADIFPVTLMDVKKIQTLFLDKVSQLQQIYSDIEIDVKLEKYRKSFWLKYLELTIKNIQMLSDHAIYLEAQKWGFVLSDEDVILHNDAVVRMQKLFFGEKLSENNLFKWLMYDYTTGVLQQKWNLLLDEEKNILQSFLEDLQVDEPILKRVEKYQSHASLDVFGFLKKRFDLDLNEKSFLEELSQDHLVYIFEKALQWYGFSGSWKVVKRSLWFISVNAEEKVIQIPQNPLKPYTVLRVLKLINHEICRHVFSAVNTDSVGFWLVGYGYLRHEEGVASYLENYLLWTDTREVLRLSKFRDVFLELYPLSKAFKLLKIIHKLFEEPYEDSHILDYFLRSKRFLAYDPNNIDRFSCVGLNRKDASYALWLQDIHYFEDVCSDEEMVQFVERSYFSKMSADDLRSLDASFFDDLDIRIPSNLLWNILAYPFFKAKILSLAPHLEWNEDLDNFLQGFFLGRRGGILKNFHEKLDNTKLTVLQQKLLGELTQFVVQLVK